MTDRVEDDFEFLAGVATGITAYEQINCCQVTGFFVLIGIILRAIQSYRNCMAGY